MANCKLPLTLALYYHQYGDKRRIKFRFHSQADKDRVEASFESLIRCVSPRSSARPKAMSVSATLGSSVDTSSELVRCLFRILKVQQCMHLQWAMARLRPSQGSALLIAHVVQEKRRTELRRAFFTLAKFATVSIQNEALQAAESLAAINIDCMEIIDALPIRLAIKSISDVYEKVQYRQKFAAFHSI